MARPLRIEYPNAWYHVMNRGRRGETVFSQGEDYEIFISLLQETSEMFDLRVSAYCLMSNHYHLLVQTPLANLSRAMRHVNGVYTQRYNRQRNIDGQLFRGRYKSVLVEEDSHLLELLRYIHRNPVRAGMCKSVKDYTWSSHLGYVYDTKKWEWLHKEFMFGMFSEDLSTAKKEYRKFVLCKDSPNILDFFSKKNLASFFGSLDFIEWIKDKYYQDKEHREVPQSKQLAPTISKIKRIVSQIYDVEEHHLSYSKRGEVNEPRNIAIYIARKFSGLPLDEIGSAFGLGKYSSVSSVICRTEQQLSRNKKLQNQIDKIKCELKKGHAKT